MSTFATDRLLPPSKKGKADVSHKSQTYKLHNLYTYLYIQEAQNDSLACIAVNKESTNVNNIPISNNLGRVRQHYIILSDSDLYNHIQTYRSLHGRSSGSDVQALVLFV